MIAAAGTAGSAEPLLEERVKLLYSHAPQVLIGGSVTSVVLVALLSAVQPVLPLAAWCALVLVLAAARYRLYRTFQARRDPRPSAWAMRYVAGALLSGCLWGYAGAAFFAPDPYSVTAIVIVLAGLAAGSVASHSAYWPSYPAFAVPAIVPFALRCLMEGTTFLSGLGVISLVFLGVNILYGRNAQATLLESIRLRFENLALVDEVTRQKDAANAARIAAEEANLAKTRFLGAVSHDLRQPAHAMRLFVDALAAKAMPGQREILDQIGLAAESLQSILSQLMEFSQIEVGGVRPRPEPTPLSDIFHRLQAVFESEAERKELRLRVVETGLWVVSDPVLLERVLNNLVANAIKFTQSGGVVIGCRREGGRVRICVADTGPGIAADQLESVFVEFRQLDNPERDRRKGLGLGLAITQRLASALGHALAVSSREGRGSIFSVACDAAPALARSGGGDATSSVELAGLRVLVIDDDPAILSAASQLMRAWDCDVRTAASGSEALALVDATWQPDAVLVDYRLRDGEIGTQVLARLAQSLGRMPPAALVTGDADAIPEPAPPDAGPIVLLKPFNGARLRALLTTLRLSTSKAEAS